MNQTWTRFLPLSLRLKVYSRGYLQNVVSNTGWQFADNLLRMGVGLFVGIWVARFLGPEQFGLLSYALAFVSVFSAVAALGLDDIIVRDIVRNPELKNEILGTALFLKLAGGLLTLAAAIGTVIVLRPGDTLSHWLVGIIAAGTIFQAFNTIDYWFHSQVQAKFVVIPRNIAFLTCALMRIALILASAPLIAFAWVALLEIVVGAAGMLFTYRSRGSRISHWEGSLSKSWSLLKDSWPLIVSGMLVLVYLRIDQVMLGQMVSNEEVGVYSVAVRLAEVWFFIPTAIYWSIFPSVIEAKGISDELFYERLQKLYNLVALSTYAIIFPTTLIAHQLVPLLFGKEYAQGGLMLAVLIWANLFMGLEIARGSFLMAMNWTRLYLTTVLLACCINIGLNYLLIPLYGGMGAVYASLISYWFASHGSCFFFIPLNKTGYMITKAIFNPKIW